MKKRSFILGLVFLMFVSSVVYPNRVKDTEQSWEEEEDRSIISSPTLSIDENNIYINLNYSGTANVWSFFDKSTLKFNINVDFIDANEGIKRFTNTKLFKKKVFLTEYPIVRSIP